MIKSISEKQNNHKTPRAVNGPQEAILLVDDDPLILDSMALLLKKDFNVLTANDRPSATTAVRNHNRHAANNTFVKVAMIDMGLPPEPHSPSEGFALISDLLALDPTIKVLVLSGQNRDAHVETALQLGAVDYLSKPAKPALLRERIHQQIEIHTLEQHKSSGKIPELVGSSETMKAIQQQIISMASSPFPALILGESGTGKELIAQAIHSQSDRANKPFVPINCAAVPSELIESVLFGHTKGAFTHAHKEGIGFFGEAQDGSIFLDELGELPLMLQVKLLRVLESGEYYRIGETQPRRTEARIIAATNNDLKQSIDAGLFREDLYHRLSILTIHVPPLRQRTEDIREIIEHFIDTYKTSFPPYRLSDAALNALKQYAFPGNIRELRNIVIRLGTQYPGATIGQSHIFNEIDINRIDPKKETIETPAVTADAPNTLYSLDNKTIEALLKRNELNLDELLTDLERRCISIALKLNDNNLSKTARALHINRSTLHSRIQKHDKTT